MQKDKPHSITISRGTGGVSPSREGGVSALDRWLLHRLMWAVGNPPITVTLWNGEDAYQPAKERPMARVVLRERGALYGMLSAPDLGFGDAFSLGQLEVQGDLIAFLETLNYARRAAQPGMVRRAITSLLHRPRANTLFGAQENIQHHYDLSNDFYRLWLDERMVYTCAYYARPEADLAQAQVAKLDHVCRKLELKPGQSVVEAGCGWGALALHMAKHYGVKVKAYNISQAQIDFARERARAEGLQSQVEFVREDYRLISGEFDRFVSVGMLEHVGPDNYPELGAVIRRTLKRGGRGLIHSIGRNLPGPNSVWIERRIFPGSRPPSLAQMMSIFEPYDFSVLDVENLRLHYARTCRDWLERFEAQRDTVREMFDEDFVRAWRLYLSGSVAAFLNGSLQLFQVVFAYPEDKDVPLTREHVYSQK